MANSKARVIRYGDRISTLWLWQKALLLVPLWSILVIPFYSAVAMLFGNVGAEFGYAMLILWAVAYFVEDVLKRRIRIEDNLIFWGFRTYELNYLISVGLGYGNNKVVPTDLMLDFESGQTLKLRLSRISSADFEGLIRLISTQQPNCKIDPVAGTLMRCKKLVRRDLADLPGRVTIPYRRRFFKEIADTFLAMWDGWVQAGPVLCVILCSPIWLTFTGWVCSIVKSDLFQSLNLHKSLVKSTEPMTSFLGYHAYHAQQAFTEFVSTYWIACFLAVLALIPLFYALLLLVRANLIVVDQSGLRLCYRVSSLCFEALSFRWSKVLSVTLIKSASPFATRQWKVRLSFKSVPPLDIDLASIDIEDRERLIKAIERWAPAGSIESQLSETMLRKQEHSYTELWLQSLSTPPEQANLEPLAPGQFLCNGRYQVIQRIGIGGQGTAYLCRESEQIREEYCGEVVLKETIIPIYVDQTVRQQAIERFEHEAKLLKLLDCNRIVRLIDYFIEDHRGYLVLEHISGKTLRQLVEERGALSEEETVDLARQMCEMLEHLHERKILHRDFTPDNLILTERGVLKLIDFNVAQQAESGSTGTIVGKHAYLPPEQFRGKPTCQSDIYAFGATLTFLLTGCDPEPITQSYPKRSNLSVSDAVNALVAECTALQSNKRFENIALVREAVNKLSVSAGQCQDAVWGDGETAVSSGANGQACQVGENDNSGSPANAKSSNLDGSTEKPEKIDNTQMTCDEQATGDAEGAVLDLRVRERLQETVNG